MIVHTYGGKAFTSLVAQRISGIEGWFVVGKTGPRLQRFLIVARESHGGGFASRDRARAAVKQLKEEDQINCI